MINTKWDDLKTRTISAAVMIIIAAGALYFGGALFQSLAIVVAGLMFWELGRMLGLPQDPYAVILGMLGSIALFLTVFTSISLGLALVAIILVLAIWQLKSWHLLFLGYGVLIFAGTISFIFVEYTYGTRWLLGLVLIVIITDLAGYFAGRILGGPKFWPAISPKKTWSGTVAGWIAAAIFSLFYWPEFAWFYVIPCAVALSFAGQMGDIAESAIKRRVGVKDSSSLIPGHGGILDRADALLGAAVAVGILIIVFSTS